MTLTAFLKIGDIAGESTRAGHEDEIDVHGIGWGIEQIARTAGSKRLRARSDMEPLVLRKFYDASSPYIAQAAESGKRFADIEVAVRKDSGEASLDYLVITMTNVIISSYSMANLGSDATDGRIEEEVELDFQQVEIKYIQQDLGGAAGDEHAVTLGG